MKQAQHFAALDGMRGTAAIIVALFHSIALYNLPVTRHMELAVEFFFCLSGFILAHTYDARLRGGMTVRQFLLRRFIRLHPMVVAGVILGLAVTAWGCASNSGVFMDRPYTTTDLLAGSGLLLALLPAGLVLHQMLYFIDSPLWSMFFEYAANIAYALNRGGRMSAMGGLAIFAILACVLLPFAIAAGGLTGFGLGNAPLFLLGFARIALPFFTGVALSRLDLPSRLPAYGDITVMAALVVFLVCPQFSGLWQYDMAGVLLICPVLVCLGVRAQISPELAPLWRHMGRLSYPFYVLHLPVMKAVHHLVTVLGDGTVPAGVAIAIGFCVALALAETVLRLYDTPFRRWLTAWFDAAALRDKPASNNTGPNNAGPNTIDRGVALPKGSEA